MISKGSCDSEDWSNDTENAALTSQDTHRKQLFLIVTFHYFAVFTVFLVSTRDFLNKKRKIQPTPDF